MSASRIVFMGTPDFAATSLRKLLGGPGRVVAVVTQPDRPGGRGQKLRASPVKAVAVEAGIPVLQPDRIKGERGAAFRAEVSEILPDLIVVVAFGQILPAELLELPPLGCINVHASLLPRWRGAGPIQWAIAAGDQETGISIMRMDEGLDTGPVILSRAIPIGPEETGGSLHDRLALLGASALEEAIDLMRAGPVHMIPQDDSAATYAPMLSREDGRLRFDEPAVELERRVRAFQPWPGAFTFLDGRLLKVLRTQCPPSVALEEKPKDPGAEPGTIVAAGSGGIEVACGEGRLRLLELQPEGKRPMEAGAFAAGRKGLAGHRLG